MDKKIEIKDMKHFILKKDSNVTVITFGGIQTWNAKIGERFPFHFCKAMNESYVVVKSGANSYVFESNSIELGRPDMKWASLKAEIEADKVRQSKL